MNGFDKKLEEMLNFLQNNNIFDKHVEYNNEEQLINLLDQIINSTIEGLIIFDENKICINANKPACEMFGYSFEEMIGKKAFEFVAPKSRELVKSKIVIKNQTPYEAIMLKKDGTKFPALLRGRDIEINNKKMRVSATIDLTELKEKEQEICKISFFDKLTNLPNRHKLINDLQDSDYYACVIFNIDKFGEINDLFGSKVGDEILKKLSNELLKEKLPIYRIGGDEFAILFKDKLDEKTLIDFIKSFINKIEKIEFKAEDKAFHIHLRAGVSINSNKLLTHADIATREAKHNKEYYEIYKEDKLVEKTYQKNIEIASIINKALEKDKIILHYQPIFDKNKKISKYECLVRLEKEDGSVLYPGEFLSIAKTIKLYNEITKRVIEKSCNFFSGKNIEFSVNLSIEDINNNECVNNIIEMVKKYKVCNNVVFEILETEGINNYEIIKNFISEVKKIGAKIAIDDFGSGYSNFKHILSLDIDYLKIDGSLIKNICEDNKSLVIVETIVNFAKKIGIKTIAEFVSSEEIFEKLKKLGIDYFQGFYLGKPSANL